MGTRRRRRFCHSIRAVLEKTVCIWVSVGGPTSTLAFLIPFKKQHSNYLIARDSSTGTRLYSPTSPQEQEDTKSNGLIKEKSNFWVSVRRRDDVDSSKSTVPFYSQLDPDGPLLSDCYRILGDEVNEPKPTCLVTMDLKELGDLLSDQDKVASMHQAMESGFTTFAGGTPDLYKRFLQQSPAMVHDRCNLITTMEIPHEISSSPRSFLLKNLHEMDAPSYDTLQFQYNPGSPYLLDLLEQGLELQREGLIRSMTAKAIPQNILQNQVNQYGYHLDSNQVASNLLTPNTELESSCWWTLDSVLAGGMLSERYYNHPAEPRLFELTQQERRFVPELHQWANRLSQQNTKKKKENNDNNDTNHWKRFQSTMMDTLQNIALKHQVRVETVALRWALQQRNKVSSLVLPPTENPNQWRQVFLVQLDEDDMDRLWKASGCRRPTADEQELTEEEMEEEELEQNEHGLFLPGSTKRKRPTRKLWV